jgi:hypothetical protein
VEDSEPFELGWLLKCNLEELIASVRPMSDKNCEQIVRAILDRIGGPTFEQLLARIVEIPRDGRGPPTNSDEFYFAIRDLFPQVPPENDVLGRLLCLLCECASYGPKRTVSPRIEQNIFPLLQSVMTHIPINPPPKICSNDPNVAQAFATA